VEVSIFFFKLKIKKRKLTFLLSLCRARSPVAGLNGFKKWLAEMSIWRPVTGLNGLKMEGRGEYCLFIYFLNLK
jgi:hypothetical protein